MAILKTSEMKGLQPVPAVSEAGELVEITFKWDTSVAGQNIAAGDFLQLMQLPSNAVLADIRVGVNATFGTTTIAAGIADAAATTALATTYIAAGALTTTAPVNANATIMGDGALAKDAPTADQRIVALAFAVAAQSTNTLYVSVRYRASRYGV